MKEIKRRIIGGVAANLLAYGISKNEYLSQKVLASRQYRLESEWLRQPAGCFTNLGKFGLEFVPLPIPSPIILPPYGVYDAISVIEGIRGYEFAGRRLDHFERLVFIASGLAPWWPAVPARSLIISTKKATEDKVYEIHKKTIADR